jgi:excisionase family DNA binding protein
MSKKTMVSPETIARGRQLVRETLFRGELLATELDDLLVDAGFGGAERRAIKEAMRAEEELRYICDGRDASGAKIWRAALTDVERRRLARQAAPPAPAPAEAKAAGRNYCGDRLLTVDEAIARLGVTRRTLTTMVQDGRLRPFRLKQRLLVLDTDVASLAESR